MHSLRCSQFRICPLLVFSLLIFLVQPVFASLGDTVDSVHSDKVRMKGTLRVIVTQRYTKHEIRLANSRVVREFVSQDGRVFGVAWEGPVLPDVKQLLGVYFEQVKQASAVQHKRGHGPLLIQTPDLIFQQTGGLRKFHGRAYLSVIVPGDVDVSEIH